MAKPLITDHLSASRHSTNTQFRVADGLGESVCAGLAALEHPRRGLLRLQLSVLAYNLGNLWRRLVLPPPDQALVAHESPAATGENRGPAGEARTVLLAPAGGRASDPAAVRRHAAEDLGAAGAGRIAGDR